MVCGAAFGLRAHNAKTILKGKFGDLFDKNLKGVRVLTIAELTPSHTQQ